MRKNKLIILVFIVAVFFACKKGGGGSVTPTPPPVQPVVPDPPAKAVLSLPAQNEVCATGENQTATESTVLFDWNDAANADSYVLSLKNLLTSTVTDQASTISSLKMTIPRGTPFSWTVTSKSSKSTVTATSDSWKFYNSGVGQTSYAPFPATLTYPTNGQVITVAGSSITLTWTGSDADNDIASYDIYYGESSTSALLASIKADNPSLSVAVTANTIYYWKVVTKDSKGNTSDSGVYQFKIN